MPPKRLDYAVPTVKQNDKRFRAARVVAAALVIILTVVANVAMLCGAESDPGFGALIFLAGFSPIVNGVLLIIGFVCALALPRQSRGYGLLSIGLPLAAIVFNLFILALMRRF